jgi:hypothetical protein
MNKELCTARCKRSVSTSDHAGPLSIAPHGHTCRPAAQCGLGATGRRRRPRGAPAPRRRRRGRRRRRRTEPPPPPPPPAALPRAGRCRAARSGESARGACGTRPRRRAAARAARRCRRSRGCHCPRCRSPLGRPQRCADALVQGSGLASGCSSRPRLARQQARSKAPAGQAQRRRPHTRPPLPRAAQTLAPRPPSRAPGWAPSPGALQRARPPAMPPAPPPRAQTPGGATSRARARPRAAGRRRPHLLAARARPAPTPGCHWRACQRRRHVLAARARPGTRAQMASAGTPASGPSRPRLGRRPAAGCRGPRPRAAMSAPPRQAPRRRRSRGAPAPRPRWRPAAAAGGPQTPRWIP